MSMGKLLSFNKPARAIIAAAIALAAVSFAGYTANRVISGRLIEMEIIYEDNPAFYSQDIKLLWGDTVYHAVHIADARRGKEIGYAVNEYDDWRIYELKGYTRDHLCAIEKASGSGLWVFSVYPPEQPRQQYILENATDRDRMERMLSVSLYSDGTARLATPPISSYALVGACSYSYTDGELLIFDESQGEIARFEVVDDTAIIFRAATVPLFAKAGARYVIAPADLPH